MGDPKTPRKIWKKPKRPLNYDLMMDELKTLGTFGLKTESYGRHVLIYQK